MLRIMPYLFLLYIIAYLDRVNVSYAALTMKGDLGFTDDVLGLGLGIFSSAMFCWKYQALFWLRNGARVVGLPAS